MIFAVKTAKCIGCKNVMKRSRFSAARYDVGACAHHSIARAELQSSTPKRSRQSISSRVDSQLWAKCLVVKVACTRKYSAASECQKNVLLSSTPCLCVFALANTSSLCLYLTLQHEQGEGRKRVTSLSIEWDTGYAAANTCTVMFLVTLWRVDHHVSISPPPLVTPEGTLW